MPARRTKIIATLGPATDAPDVLEAMLKAGVDLVRMNFSHGTAQDHIDRASRVRNVAATLDHPVAILSDLQGPKIRIGRFAHGPVTLHEGQTFVIDPMLPHDGDAHQVSTDYVTLPSEVEIGDRLLLDDGRIECDVQHIDGTRVVCTVQQGGELADHKGLNRRGGGLSADAFTDKDKLDLDTALALGSDYIALSFVREPSDVRAVQERIRAHGHRTDVIVKIERADAIPNLDSLIEVADGLMVARGDLGVEIGDAEVPAIQKRIIHRAIACNTPVITATQMMESMITHTTPTRAEVSDVANAVLDGSDAVMLSGETAVGQHPALVVQTMARCCVAAEQHASTLATHHLPRPGQRFEAVDAAIAFGSRFLACQFPIRAIICLTESGTTPRYMSRVRSPIPIVALSPCPRALRRMALYRDVTPLAFSTEGPPETLTARALDHCVQQGCVALGDWVLVTRGDQVGVGGGTNSLKICQITPHQENDDVS